MRTYTTAPTKEHIDLHHALCNAMAKTHPKILTIRDYLNVISRIQGQLIAACFPEERTIARTEAILNMDHALDEFSKQMYDPRSTTAVEAACQDNQQREEANKEEATR